METNVIETVETGNERRIISQTQAARLRNISRQRIHQLVTSHRLTVPVNERGEQIRGGVYLDEVVSLTEGPRGRPRLTEEERAARDIDDTYRLGDMVRWTHVPRDGYGYSIELAGTVVKTGAKRLKLAFYDAAGEPCTAWVPREQCELGGRLNGQGGTDRK